MSEQSQLCHKLSPHVTVVGGPWAFVYIIHGEQHLVVDTGMSFQTKNLINKIETLLSLIHI